MAAGAFVAVDWGTTNARFTLASAAGTALDEQVGPGIAALDDAAAIEAACFSAIGNWPGLPVVIAGMAGSDIGWRPAPYISSPATAGAVHAAAVKFAARGVSIVLLPGVKTIRDDGFPDVMRGEETQIFGSMSNDTGLVCLPGTHSKWAQVVDGKIACFHTAMSGELMDVVGRGTILLNPKHTPFARPGPQFLEGVTAINRSILGLETALFTVRSRQTAGTLTAQTADNYLAGLCIGSDIRSALALHPDVRSMTLVGAPPLTALYATALASLGVMSRQIDGKAAALAGLTSAYQAIFA
jgi:2-dehydro-3-deoxygalactonokinase